MIFAEMEYQNQYWEFHDELLAFLSRHFSLIEHGLQSDSHFSISVDGERVVIDTFTSMKHQIKAKKPGTHVQKVIAALRRKYALRVYEKPELEPHEDDYSTSS